MVNHPDHSWDTARLGECATWISGGTPPTDEPSYWGGDIPWITSSSLQGFFIRDSVRRVTELGIENGTRLVPPDTTMFVVRGMSLRKEWRVGITTRAMSFGQDCKALIPDDRFDPLFFAYATRAASGEVLRLVERAGHGTGRLSTGALKDVEIPLPPRPEQQAIARVLRAVQRAKEATEQVITAAQALKRSLIHHLFIDEWPIRRLGEVVEKPQYGFTASARADRLGPRLLRITDIQNGGVDWSSVPFCECEPRDLAKHALEPGDVVVARIGATTGKALYVGDVPEAAVFASYLIRLRARPEVAARYLGYFTETEAFWRQINTEKGGRLKTGVNARTLADLLIPLPPRADQAKLVRDLEAVDRKVAAEEVRRDALAILFDALLHDLMTMRLRLTDLALEVV